MSSIITNLVVHKVIYNLGNWKLENVGGGGGGGRGWGWGKGVGVGVGVGEGGGGGGGRGHDKDVIWSGSSEK